MSGTHERGGTCIAPPAGALQLSGGGLLAVDTVSSSKHHLQQSDRRRAETVHQPATRRHAGAPHQAGAFTCYTAYFIMFSRLPANRVAA